MKAEIKYRRVCEKCGYTLYLNTNAGTFAWTKDNMENFSKPYYCESDAQFALENGAVTKYLDRIKQ